MEAQAKITQAFGQQASTLIGNYADQQQDKAAELRAKAAVESNPTLAQELNDQASAIESNWGPDGTMRVLAHTIVGGLTGGLAGAAGAAAGTLTAPSVASALNKAGVDPDLAKSLTGLSSTLVGTAVGGTAGGAAAYNEVVNNFLKHADAAALKKEIEACTKKTGGCSDGDVTSIFKKYKEISDQNIAAVQSCVIAGDVACVQKNLSEVASVSEVKVLPFGYTKLEDTLIGRQVNVISYGSVTGNASLMGTDVDQAREVANFRTDNCGGLSVAACDGLVRDAINYRLLRMATLSAVAAATPALVGEARKLVVPKEKAPTVVADRDRYTADQDLPDVYKNQGKTASITSGGTANSATAPRLKEQIANDSLMASGANMSNIKVIAQGEISGQVYIDTNQAARAANSADASVSTLVPADRVNARAPTVGVVNGDMSTAHAEIGVIQQAAKAGVAKEANMTITVIGEAVCTFCRGDIPAAANAAELQSLTIHEAATGKTYYWMKGMNLLKVKTP